MGPTESSGDAAAQAARIPPGQHLTDRFPVLHAGSVAAVDHETWSLRVAGLVQNERELGWEELMSLPSTELTCDIHCVTRWTKLDTRWKGVRARDLLARTEILPEAKHVLVRAEAGWTTNLPLEELLREDVLIAYEYEGQPLPPDHGGPVRLVVPRLYFWKSAKWLTGLDFVAEQVLGYWESLGYHELGDPWLEQRYSEPRSY
jgi:DMSO/TMAO reductase YedYZ molybdopterin-dependent catalytic subunit